MGETQLTLFPEPCHWGSVQRRRPRTRRQECPRHLEDGRGRHDNSLAARGDERLQAALTGRRAQIVAWLRAHGPATDREIVAGLYFPGADMNPVRPRVTELLDARAVEEVDRVRDTATGMMVRRVGVTGEITQRRRGAEAEP
jgi:hypothetical protein